MKNPSLTKLLEVIERDVGAREAKLEFGGLPTEDARSVSLEVSDGWRMTVSFAEPPKDREAVLERLRAYATSFGDGPEAPSMRSPTQHENPTLRVDETLAALAGQSHARAAFVVDEQSPIIWGASLPREQLDELEDYFETGRAFATLAARGHDLWDTLSLDEPKLDALLRTFSAREQADLRAVVERLRRRHSEPERYPWRTDLLIARALTETSRHIKTDNNNVRYVERQPNYGCLARAFASIYRVVLVFDHSFSELHAEGALVRALPRLERMVLSLPPIEPPPRGAKVVKLPLR
ncbi:MAG: hypothetical protein SFV15_26555 [Polyangiaceae bacterium]|nr:hypothetical protein [Polyangiaceae bacterium]